MATPLAFVISAVGTIIVQVALMLKNSCGFTPPTFPKTLQAPPATKTVALRHEHPLVTDHSAPSFSEEGQKLPFASLFFVLLALSLLSFALSTTSRLPKQHRGSPLPILGDAIKSYAQLVFNLQDELKKQRQRADQLRRKLADSDEISNGRLMTLWTLQDEQHRALVSRQTTDQATQTAIPPAAAAPALVSRSAGDDDNNDDEDEHTSAPFGVPGGNAKTRRKHASTVEAKIRLRFMKEALERFAAEHPATIGRFWDAEFESLVAGELAEFGARQRAKGKLPLAEDAPAAPAQDGGVDGGVGGGAGGRRRWRR